MTTFKELQKKVQTFCGSKRMARKVVAKVAREMTAKKIQSGGADWVEKGGKS